MRGARKTLENAAMCGVICDPTPGLKRQQFALQPAQFLQAGRNLIDLFVNQCIDTTAVLRRRILKAQQHSHLA